MSRARLAAAMLAALALAQSLAGVAEGAVTASAADGFTLVIEVDVKAPPAPSRAGSPRPELARQGPRES